MRVLPINSKFIQSNKAVRNNAANNLSSPSNNGYTSNVILGREYPLGYSKINFTSAALGVKNLKEMMEQPKVLESIISNLAPIEKISEAISPKIDKAKSLVMVASGSSFNALGAVADHISQLLGIPVHCERSSNLLGQALSKYNGSVAFFASQSGRTSDTLAVLEEFKSSKIPTVVLTNVANSKMSKVADYTLDINAGLEEAVPATKSVIATILNAYLLGLEIAKKSGKISEAKYQHCINNLRKVPAQTEKMLAESVSTTVVDRLSQNIKNKTGIILIGRSPYEPVGAEGVLKISESMGELSPDIRFIPSGEVPHGPITGINKSSTVISLIPQGFEHYPAANHSLENLQEVAERTGAKCCIIGPNSLRTGRNIPKEVEFIPIEASEDPVISSIFSTIRLQQLANKSACSLGVNPDSPHLLGKAVIKASGNPLNGWKK